MKIFQKKQVKYSTPKPIEWKGGTLPYVSIADYKFSILLDDGNLIEAGVFDLLVDGGQRELHACISIQAGCKYGCRMCSSGKAGFIRNLNSREILKQIKILANFFHIEHFDLLSFMGIGEPTDNLDNFIESINILVSKCPQYIGKISFATICLPEKLEIVSKAIISKRLPPFKMIWISLIAATDKKRKQVVSKSKIASVQEVINSAKRLAKCHKKTDIWINYLLFKGFNDSRQDALSLSKLLYETENELYLMLTEPNNDLPNYSKGTINDLDRFKSYLDYSKVKNKITFFRAAGTKINAGCGEFIFVPYTR